MPSLLPLCCGLLLLPAAIPLIMPISKPSPRGDTKLTRHLRALCKTAPQTVAHRGASADYPENTLPAFRAAVEAGAAMVELDFHQTADGVLVVIHDATLDRTTDAEQVLGGKKIAIAATSAADVALLDAGSWKHQRFAGARVPTLDEALDVIQQGAITMIEHKGGDAATLVKLLRRKKLVDAVLVQSFDWKWLQEIHQLEPRLTLGALSGEPVKQDTLAAVERTGASLVHWGASTIQLEDIEEFHRRGYLICVYTVDADLQLLGSAPLGLDLVTTNRPARLVELTTRGLLARPRRDGK